MYLKHHAGAESPVKAASFSSDGRIVTTVDSDLVVAACNATTGEKIAVPKLKIGVVSDIVIAPDRIFQQSFPKNRKQSFYFNR